MNRVATAVVGCLLSVHVFAADPAAKTAAPMQDKKPGVMPHAAPDATPTATTPAEAEKQMSCGEKMAQNAQYPAAFAAVTTNVTELLNAHAAWMEKDKSKEAKTEAKALRKLAKEHEDATRLMKKISEGLASAKSWPASNHDPKNVDMAAVMGIMTRLSAAERELGMLMTKHSAQIEAEIEHMKAMGGSGHEGHTH